MFISQTTDSHFANYRFSFRKLQILISQTTDSHFANHRFSFRKLQISISQTTDSHFANYRFPFRKLQISISQTTDFHFANYRFPFRFVPFRFANYSKPTDSTTCSATAQQKHATTIALDISLIKFSLLIFLRNYGLTFSPSPANRGYSESSKSHSTNPRKA